MKAVLIVNFAISSRIGVISSGSSTPGRITLILTDVPRGPFNFESTSGMDLNDHIANPQSNFFRGGAGKWWGDYGHLSKPGRYCDAQAVILAALIFTK